jgi:hypothetical protein
MVGGTGIEPVAPSMSRKCSPAELTARLRTVFRSICEFRLSIFLPEVRALDGSEPNYVEEARPPLSYALRLGKRRPYSRIKDIGASGFRPVSAGFPSLCWGFGLKTPFSAAIPELMAIPDWTSAVNGAVLLCAAGDRANDLPPAPSATADPGLAVVGRAAPQRRSRMPKTPARVRLHPKPKKARLVFKVPRKAAPPRDGSKLARILALITRPSGASLGELVHISGWREHSVRAALTGI